jgi:hypothetical protein
MSTDLGVPTVQHAGQDGVSVGANGIEFSTQGHYFHLPGDPALQLRLRLL